MKRRRKQALLTGTGTSLIIGGAAVIAADVARRLFRSTQLFCPDPKPAKSWNPADYGVPPDCVSEEWFETPDGEWLYGWYCRSTKPIASALFCHGNTGNLTTVAEMIPHLLDAGYNVFFFDYRGFGRSTGRPTLGGVVADGVTAARFHDRIRPQELPSILYGFSLGGAIAAQVSRHHHFDGLILQSTFTSLPDITRVTFPRLPLHLLAGRFFNTVEVLRALRMPLLILHGTADEVVPCWMAHALYDACASSSRRIHTVDGGLHKDLFVRDSDALVWAINQFVEELPRHEAEAALPEENPVDQLFDNALRFVRRKLRRAAAVNALATHAR